MSLLRFERVVKHYGGVRALRGVSLAILAGEAHALVGENGAGKSTLMKVAAGIVRPDEGRVLVDGRSVTFNEPRDALDAGIGLVHQETCLFPNLDVTENIFAGRELTSGGRLQRGEMRARTADLLAELHLAVSPDAEVSRLSAAQQQLLQVARALAFDCRVLILDEPTTSLTDAEVDHLFAVLDRLRARGVTIVYVSHRLPEVFRLCTRVTVLRDGELVGTWDLAQLTPQDVVHAMVGRDLEPGQRPQVGATQCRLAVRGVSRGSAVRDVSIEVCAGEVVGLFGLVGAGRTELVETIFGLHRHDAGTMTLDGAAYAPSTPVDAIRAGVALVPEMRQAQGLFFDLPLSENLVLAREAASRRWRRAVRRERRECHDLLGRWGIKAASPDVLPGSLSGGNQQKVVLARWLLTAPKVLLLDEPTKGVDIGAKHDIHLRIRDEATRGMACLVVSSDLPELLALADRIVVMKEGRVQGEVLAGATEAEVMRLATTPHGVTAA